MFAGSSLGVHKSKANDCHCSEVTVVIGAVSTVLICDMLGLRTKREDHES